MNILNTFLFACILFSCSLKKEIERQSPRKNFLHDPLLSKFQAPSSFYLIDPKKDTVIKLNERGTILHIPAFSFIDQYGKTIHSKVEISFKEFTNAADIAFSGINMNYRKGNETLNFNSSGMFEINGKSQNKDVEIKNGKSLTIDYSLTQNIPNTDFYRLNDQNTNWELVQEIPTLKESLAPIKASETSDDRLLDITFEDPSFCPEFKKFKDVRFRICDEVVLDTNELKMSFYQVAIERTKDYGKYLLKLAGYDQDAQFVVRQYIVNPVFSTEDFERASVLFDRIYDESEKEALNYYNEMKRKEKLDFESVDAENYEYDRQLIIQAKLNEELLKKQELLFSQNKNNSSPIVTTSIEALNYRQIVNGLAIASFGIYNCDQAYRIKNQLSCFPIYQNEKGEIIENTLTLSLIDLNVNAAFSFNPQNFQYEEKGNFVLALFTTDKKLYILKSAAMNELKPNNDGRLVLTMKDKTNEIKNRDDLRNFLGV